MVGREGLVGKINWGRILLCGLLTGGLWFSLVLLIMAFVGKDFVMAVVAAAQRNPNPSALPRWLLNPAVFFALNLVIGLWMMWLYAAIRPRYGPGPKTAAVAAFAVWFIGVVTDAFFGLSGIILPTTLVAPVAAALPAMVLATVVGARYYQE